MIPGLDILADCVRHHLDLDAPVTLERIATGKFNTSWFVHIGDDRECVLRIAPPDDNVFLFYERQMMRQEPRIHQLLLENTDVPVAPVIAFDHSRPLIDRTFILMERLRGEPISDAVPINDAAVSFRLGQCLAQVHSQTTEAAMVRRVFYLLYEHQKYIVIRAGRSNEPAVAESYRDDCLNMVRKTFGDVI